MMITVYIEYVFVISFLMNYMVIYITQIILGITTEKVGFAAFLVAFTYSLTIMVFGVNTITSIASVIVGPAIVSIMLFELKRENYIHKIITLYIVTIVFGVFIGGLLSYTYPGYLFITFIKDKSEILTLLIWMTYTWVIFRMLINGLGYLRKKLMHSFDYCDVSLKYEGVEIIIKGLVDSGDSLYYGSHPVSIVEFESVRDLLRKKPKGLFTVYYKSLGTEKGMLYGVVFDEMIINVSDSVYKALNVYVAIYKGKVSSSGEYSMIIHKDCIK